MKQMTRDEWMSFIQEGTKTGKLATTRTDGRPHCVPVWCIFENEQVMFMTMRASVKAKNIERDNRVCITFDNDIYPYDFVTIEGVADIRELCIDELLPISTKIAARYVPLEQSEEYGERNAAEGEVLIVITPSKVISARGVAE
jgi:PPOX class probable F420-dependent enzyme